MPEVTFDLSDEISWTAYCIYNTRTQECTPLSEEQARELAKTNPQIRALLDAHQTPGD